MPLTRGHCGISIGDNLLPYSNTQIEHWNPGATKPLILPVHVVCNTSDEELHSNIRINSRRPGLWLRQEQPHEKIAVICGSGPSLADTLDSIKDWVKKGASIFALNGSAKFLNENGIFPDYQVIIDAREQTADLVGPAKEHLFGSQVHPKCFEKAPYAKVWHLQIENIEDLFPQDGDPDEHLESYALVGGAASVGNTAPCLAYAMGYRNMQLYGYDSCHRENKGHAFDQPINNGDPCAFVSFAGKQYMASLTMKLQAEKFQLTARDLQDLGCRIEVHGSGLLPDMWNIPSGPMEEREKYERLYITPQYRMHSPGEKIVCKFIGVAKPHGMVIDFGCGTGRAGLRMKEAGLDPHLIDFVRNSRDPDALLLPFTQHDLINAIPLSADFGFSADVMEHIPQKDVEKVIKNIMAAAKTVFFQICTCKETFGSLIGQQLHLTVEGHQWWKSKFQSLGYLVDWEQEIPSEAESLFLVKRLT